MISTTYEVKLSKVERETFRDINLFDEINEYHLRIRPNNKDFYEVIDSTTKEDLLNVYRITQNSKLGYVNKTYLSEFNKINSTRVNFILYVLMNHDLLVKDGAYCYTIKDESNQKKTYTFDRDNVHVDKSIYYVSGTFNDHSTSNDVFVDSNELKSESLVNLLKERYIFLFDTNDRLFKEYQSLIDSGFDSIKISDLVSYIYGHLQWQLYPIDESKINDLSDDCLIDLFFKYSMSIKWC